MKRTLVILMVLLTYSPAFAAEKDYQKAWCSGANTKMEYVLADKTRVDCLTDTHAIEVDFGKKWAESIGQSLFYASMTGKRAGVLLILEKKSDSRFLARLNHTIEANHLPIDVWTTGPGAQ